MDQRVASRHRATRLPVLGRLRTTSEGVHASLGASPQLFGITAWPMRPHTGPGGHHTQGQRHLLSLISHANHVTISSPALNQQVPDSAVP